MCPAGWDAVYDLRVVEPVFFPCLISGEDRVANRSVCRAIRGGNDFRLQFRHALHRQSVACHPEWDESHIRHS